MSGRLRFLNQEEVARMMQLAQSPYRPPEILALQKKIEEETRVAELHTSLTGVIDGDEAMKIVNLRLELDRLYALWVQGKIQ